MVIIMIKIAPSLLAADLTNLERDIAKIEVDADMLHIDVMDGHFVPNLGFGLPFVAGIRGITQWPLDVHLMISHPLSYIERFAKAGADILTVHIESRDDAEACIKAIKSLGLKAGIALNPDTQPERIRHICDSVDMVLQMTVFPGFGGQSLVDGSLKNIREIRSMLGDDKDLQVDGGIYIENVEKVTSQGANVIVSGTGIFGQANPALAAQTLRARAGGLEI